MFFDLREAMEAKFSQRVKDVISYSREEALRLGNDFIGVEHLLLGLIREGDGKAIRVMLEFQLNLKMVRTEIEQTLSSNATIAKTHMIEVDVHMQTHMTTTLPHISHNTYQQVRDSSILLSLIPPHYQDTA